MNSSNVFLLLWQTQRKLDLVNTLEKPGTPDTALKKRKAYLPLHQTQQQKHSLLETKITLRIPYKEGREPVQQLYVRILNAVTFLA